MSDLTDFLVARTAEDGRDLPYEFSAGSLGRSGGVEFEWRSRVLAEGEAMRSILELHRDDRDAPPHCMEDDRLSPCDTLRALASIYADHPDYRDEWKLA